MVSLLIAALLGFVQGVTEFLPISSSGHLVLAHAVLPPLAVDELAFDVLLHFATLCAVIVALWPDVRRVFAGAVAWLAQRPTPDSRLAGWLVLGSVPAVLIGALFGAAIEARLRSPGVVAVTLAAVALLFFWVERQERGGREMTDVTWRGSLWVGSAQALALIPGVSRSGITIVAGLKMGLQRAAAARFSFLLSIPAIAGAAIVELPALWRASLTPRDWGALTVGSFVALVTGIASIRWFLRWLRSGTLRPFAWYRLALAAAVVVVWIIGAV